MVTRTRGIAAVAVASAALLSGCAGVGPGQSGSGACAGPSLRTEHSSPGPGRPNHVVVSPGQRLTVHGVGYGSCRDTNHQPPATPLRDLTVSVRQGDFREVLATVSAQAPDGSFTVAVELPTGLHPGKATLRTSVAGEQRLRLHIQE